MALSKPMGIITGLSNAVNMFRQSPLKYSTTSLLFCSLCEENYDDPIIIECHHSFCKKCLRVYIQSKNMDKSSRAGKKMPKTFKCPDKSCRKENKLPPSGVSGFPASFYIEEMARLDSQNTALPPKPMCESHEGMELKFYCRKCSTTICQDCKVLEHADHEAAYATKVAKEKRTDVAQFNERIDRAIKVVMTDKQNKRKEQLELMRAKEKIMQSLRMHAEEIKSCIDNEVVVMEEEITKGFNGYEIIIMEEISYDDKTCQDLQEQKKFSTKQIENKTDHDVIAAQNTISQCIKYECPWKVKPGLGQYQQEIGEIYRKGEIKWPDLSAMIGSVTCRSSHM